MRLVKWTLATLLALLLLAVAAAAVYVWRSHPTLDGEIRAPGLKAPVQLRRDASDVTHIQAQSLADAYFALGWVHAQERGWQLEFNRRVMHGRLSELFGPATLDTDRTLRKLGVLQAAYLLRKWWREESEWGAKIKRWAERRGVRTRPMELDE